MTKTLDQSENLNQNEIAGNIDGARKFTAWMLVVLLVISVFVTVFFFMKELHVLRYINY